MTNPARMIVTASAGLLAVLLTKSAIRASESTPTFVVDIPERTKYKCWMEGLGQVKGEIEHRGKRQLMNQADISWSRSPFLLSTTLMNCTRHH